MYGKQDIQILTAEANDWYQVYNEKYNVIHVNDYKTVDRNIPVVCSGDLLHENVRHWLTNNQRAIYVARGHLGNHLYKTKKHFRFSINGWANIKLMDKIPYPRFPFLSLVRHPWKVEKVKKVLIAPSKMTSKVWDPVVSFNWADSLVDKFPGAEVRIRRKVGTPGLRWYTLWDDLDWADLVVSQSSAVTVEAFWYGKKVISTEPCSTWAVKKNTLEDWDNPEEPDRELRDRWHEHIAWSQYTVDEIKRGEWLDLLQSYFGDINNIGFDHVYNIDHPC